MIFKYLSTNCVFKKKKLKLKKNKMILRFWPGIHLMCSCKFISADIFYSRIKFSTLELYKQLLI